MSGTGLVTAICQILLAGLTEIGTGIASAINSTVTSLAFTGTGNDQTMSVFMNVFLAFAGVALGLALCRLVVNWIASFTKSHL